MATKKPAKKPAKKAPAKKAAKKKAAPKKNVPRAIGKVNKKEDQRWQAEDDLRTLTRADEMRSDKGRMDRVAKLAKEQIATAKKFTTI
tara:strand:- start:104 stop:367 length:264 start_codon:yes stop_codon:yes gene_type:complete